MSIPEAIRSQNDGWSSVPNSIEMMEMNRNLYRKQ